MFGSAALFLSVFSSGIMQAIMIIQNETEKQLDANAYAVMQTVSFTNGYGMPNLFVKMPKLSAADYWNFAAMFRECAVAKNMDTFSIN